MIDVSEVKGPLGELMDQFSGANGRERFEEFKLWLKGVTAGLLKFVQNVAVTGVQEFVAKDHFTKGNTKVKFWVIGDNFSKVFLGKIERSVAAGQVAVHSLLQASLDPEIMTALGSQGRIMKLAHLYQLLQAQGQGQAVGPLLVNGYANIAYIEDDDGIVWAVVADWGAGSGWCVGANSVEDRRGWGADDQVLSQVV